MRIVAGKYGSRSLKSPKNDATRPTQDKIKGAIFSSLGNMFDGGNFLDCYSGTGNMGLEAVSRGMDHATLVDNNKGAISVIKENVKSLKAEKETKIICGNIFSVLERLTLKYDVVYIDPPYAKQDSKIRGFRYCKIRWSYCGGKPARRGVARKNSFIHKI